MSAGTPFAHRGGGIPTVIPTDAGTVAGEPLVWSITSNKWVPQSGTWYFTNTDLYGTNVIVSSVTASGKIRAASEDLSGTLLASSVVSPTVMSTNVTASGIVVADSATLQLGSLPTGITNARGLQTKSVDNSLALWSVRTDAARVSAVDIIADVNKATVNEEMWLTRFGWMNDSDVVQDSMYIKDGAFEFPTQGSVELLSTEADGPGVVAVTLGTDTTFTIPVLMSGLNAPRATLLSIVNGPISSGEKFSVDVTGNVCLNKNYEGQMLCWKSLSEDVTVPATLSGYTTGAIIPSGSIVQAVSSYVTQSVPGVNTIDIGVDGASTRYGTKLLALQGSAWRGTEAGQVYYSQDTAVRVTPNSTPTAATGRVRLTIHYVEIVPPTA